MSITALPLEPPHGWPNRSRGVAEYLDLGETEYHTELVEGALPMSPSVVPDHATAMGELVPFEPNPTVRSG